MIAWILGIVVVGLVALAGYYQGALRAAISFVGLVLASILASPLAGPMKSLLSLVGLKHPAVQAIVAPVAVFIVVVAIFKIVAAQMHKKIDTYYKYKVSDTQRGLFERVNQRLGVAVGVANGVIYFFALTVLFYSLGYFTVQVEAAQNSPLTTRALNAFARDLESSGMAKAAAPFMPSSGAYFDAADVVGDLYHTPLLQSRVAQYPAFLSLAERQEFKNMAGDVTFQEQAWLRQPRPRFSELINHERMRPIAKDPGMFGTMWSLAKPDVADLKTYLETGQSPKYGHEKILGRWEFDYRESFARARKAKPLMTLQEIRAARKVMGALNNSVFTALIDHKAIFKVASSNNVQVLEGTWQAGSEGNYVVSLSQGGKTLDVPVVVEDAKLILVREGQALVFEK